MRSADTEHIRGAKDCRNDIAALTRDRDVRQSPWPRGPQSLKLACREAKALFAGVDRCDPAQARISLILNEDI